MFFFRHTSTFHPWRRVWCSSRESVCSLIMWSCFIATTLSLQGALLSLLLSLLGHEFPFSIHMSHVRYSQGGGRDAAAPPADRLKAEQLQVYKQFQFILKPRPVEPPQQHTGKIIHSVSKKFKIKIRALQFHAFWAAVISSDFSGKPFKRRRSLIAWAFWRGSSSNLNELSLSTARGCLFGQPLSSVCAGDTLPKPVMVSVCTEWQKAHISFGSWTFLLTSYRSAWM